MSKINISELTRKVSETENSPEQQLSNNFYNWSDYRKTASKNFMKIPNELFTKGYIEDIGVQSFALYAYYFYRAKNETGVSWPSISTIAEELGVSDKSIVNWNKILCEIGLIYREPRKKTSVKTYLLPLSDYLIIENKKNYKDIIKDSNDEIDGELVGTFHLFQWRKNNKTDDYDIPHNVMALVFQRKYKLSSSKNSFIINKVVLCENGFEKITLSDKRMFRSGNYTFKSPELSDPRISGLVVETTINLKKVSENVLESILNISKVFNDNNTEENPFEILEKIEDDFIVKI